MWLLQAVLEEPELRLPRAMALVEYHVRRNEVARRSHAKTWRAQHRGGPNSCGCRTTDGPASGPPRRCFEAPVMAQAGPPARRHWFQCHSPDRPAADRRHEPAQPAGIGHRLRTKGVEPTTGRNRPSDPLRNALQPRIGSIRPENQAAGLSPKKGTCTNSLVILNCVDHANSRDGAVDKRQSRMA